LDPAAQSAETDPVGPGETVLRRIPRKPEYYRPGLPVSFLAFRPISDDSDGLSLYRRLFTTEAQVAVSGGNKAGYVVARLQVQSLLRLELEVVASPDPKGPRGHCILPRLTYETRREQWSKELQFQLAQLATDLWLGERQAGLGSGS
jgi:hypothetical protein